MMKIEYNSKCKVNALQENRTSRKDGKRYKMNTVNITLTLDEVDTVREALTALINKYSEWAEEAYDIGKDKLSEGFEEDAQKVFRLLVDKFHVEQ